MADELEADVVVAGAGAAGLAAALRCAQGGRFVVLLDARETYLRGCNTAMSTGMIPAGGSRWQREAGVEDSPERFYEDVMHKTGGQADPVIARALTASAPELVAWLADACQVPLELVTDFSYPGHSRDRCHAVPERSGRALHTRMNAALEARPEIELAVPMRLLDVELDASGRVSGAVVQPPGGAPERIATAAVVLATNGFGAAPELVRRHLPEIADALYFGGDGSTGDALRIGERLDADLRYLDAYQGHGSVAEPHAVLVTWATVMHGAILVNREGERFGDESAGYSEYASRVLAQPEGVAWVVLDERIDRACRQFADYQDLLEARAVRWAEDVAALAATVGAPAERLEATLAAAARAARGGAEDADPFGRATWGEPLRAPYGAVRVTGALFHTQGGLAVDESARVLRGGQPIAGLYAAGGAAAGISGHGAAGYLAGNGLLSALGLGYLAGAHIAEASPAPAGPAAA
jgi:fumarate reductase flavoprotein subunit